MRTIIVFDESSGGRNNYIGSRSCRYCAGHIRQQLTFITH